MLCKSRIKLVQGNSQNIFHQGINASQVLRQVGAQTSQTIFHGVCGLPFSSS
jgi:hypothetical protein